METTMFYILVCYNLIIKILYKYMLYWVFDLDYTLYQLPRYIDFSYIYLNKNNKLNKQLITLPLKKILFTNGTRGHAAKCLELMNLENIFDNIVAREDVDFIMKPSEYSFKKFNYLNNINNEDKVVFFEDSIENLITAKNKFNWITVLISPKQIKHKSVDFCFPHIDKALSFFLDKIHYCIN